MLESLQPFWIIVWDGRIKMNVFGRWEQIWRRWGGGVGSLFPKIALATIYSLNVIEINPELPRSIFDIFKQIIIFCNPSWEPEHLAGLIILQI